MIENKELIVIGNYGIYHNNHKDSGIVDYVNVFKKAKEIVESKNTDD